MTAGGMTVGVTDTVKGDTEQIIGGQSTTQDLINKRFDSFGGGGSTTNIVNEIDTSDLAKVGQVIKALLLRLLIRLTSWQTLVR